jgi:uncharacterized protein YjiS (DUF1127 family)
MLALIARRYLAWKEQSQMRRELYNLTDRELADIGINRSEIPRIVLGCGRNSEEE